MSPCCGYRAVVVVALALAAQGCSRDEPAAPPAPAVFVSPAKSGIESGYQMVENFHVGENVFVRSLALDPANQHLWVGTSVGVVEVDTKTRDMVGTYTREQGLANEYVFGMLVDSRGNKWFGTNGGGISRYDGKKWQTLFPMHGLADYWVYSFAEQPNGHLWIGTWAGLSDYDPKTGQFHNYLKELVNEWVYGLGVDSKGRVWIGTEGGINSFDGQTWQTWTHKDGLGAPNDDNLPASTNTGLGTRTRHDLTIMAQGAPTYNPNYVFALLVAPDDSVWAGTWGGGVAHYDGKAWSNFTTKDGLAGNIVYSVARDAHGGMWFGTNGGLSYYDGKNWYTFTQAQGLLDNNIYAIVLTPAGDVWVGSRGGVVLLNQNSPSSAPMVGQ